MELRHLICQYTESICKNTKKVLHYLTKTYLTCISKVVSYNIFFCFFALHLVLRITLFHHLYYWFLFFFCNVGMLRNTFKRLYNSNNTTTNTTTNTTASLSSKTHHILFLNTKKNEIKKLPSTMMMFVINTT